ncbi:MAG: hypothetical protein ABL982_20320, partial [Vicinamibacterales bacterium]
HIFCGIVGPGFVTVHTSFKFGGLISVAYWSMVAVVLSGFVGRYLFMQIPRSLRGLELSQADVERRATELAQWLSDAAVPEPLLQAVSAFEARAVPAGPASYASLFSGERRLRAEARALRASVEAMDGAPAVHDDVIAIATERALLRRRMASLHKTKRLFELWHVFHMPLVYIMFAIVAAHVAITLYMGYVPFVG